MSLLKLKRTLGLLVILVTGCAPSRGSPANLPTAEVRIVHAGTATSQPTVLPPTDASTTSAAVSLTPTAAPTVPSVQALAARTYGKRLIQHISLPSIGVDSGVVAVGWHMTGPADPQANSAEWDSPGPAVGWVVTSGLPDTGGNVILYGHNNMYGSVFKNLWKLQPGDEVTLQTGQDSRQYQVDRVLLLPMLNANPTQKQAYLAYLAETAQPRLTIISCWPPESNTQRVVVIAYPVTIP